jgi:hypothetical protein
LDLTPEDLQVSEIPAPAEKDSTKKHRWTKTKIIATSDTITGLHLVDPNGRQLSDDDARGGIQITANCLERSTRHYRLAFRPGPDGWNSGNHTVVIETKRPGVKLFYRHQYYVGLTELPASPPVSESEAIKLRARLIDSGGTDVLRYAVTIDADSLSFVTLGENGREVGIDRHVAIDYGVCNFNSRGLPISFFNAPLEKVVSSAEYARALARGFAHVLEIPAQEHMAMTRVVVWDRATGNLGAVDVPSQRPEKVDALQETPAAAQTASDLKALENSLDYGWARDPYGQQMPLIMQPPQGPIGSFGSIVAASHSFCGDVYELPHTSSNLPDFRELDPIGSLYTSTLDVPDQNFENTSGLPG